MPVSDGEPEAVPEDGMPVSDGEPEAVPEDGIPVSDAEPEVAGPVADAVSEVTGPDDEPLSLEIGMTEDALDVSGIGTTVVGIMDESPTLDATDDRSDETSEASVPEVDTEGNEVAAVTEDTRLSPVPSREEITPLESGVGRIPTAVVESVELSMGVETETPVPLVEDPRIVERPTVIPDELASGIAVSITLDKSEEVAEVTPGIILEGRRPVEDSGKDPVDAEGVDTAPLVSEVPVNGIIGGTRLVVDVATVVAEIAPLGEVVPGAASGTLVAVPAVVEPALVNSEIPVDRNVEPRLSVAVTTTDESGDKGEVRLIAGVVDGPTGSPEVAPLETGDAVPADTVLTDVPAVRRDEAGDDSIVAVRSDPEAGIDVSEAGSEVAGTDDSTEV
jgi:hypothetical protein